MKFRVKSLDVECKRKTERIDFSDLTYFYGPMGSGKSSIARLIDYCLGGELEMTPALQSEFVSASLYLEIEDRRAVFSREIDANKVRVKFDLAGEVYDLLVPARKPDGVVILGTSIEVLSDVIFMIAGINPPRVKRSKLNDDSDLQRLSFRDLYWFCYLDQNQMDSNFFNLDSEANVFKQLKSRDVMRLLLGYHQEHIADLEERLTAHRDERQRLEAGLEGIKDLFKAANVSSEIELAEEKARLEKRVEELSSQILTIREQKNGQRSSFVVGLQDTLRRLLAQHVASENALAALQDRISSYSSHKNELLSLATKFRRSITARNILGNTNFVTCPECSRELPPSTDAGTCGLCHQEVVAEFPEKIDAATEADLKARVSELSELIERHQQEHGRTKREIAKTEEQLVSTQRELDRQVEAADSAILAETINLERQRSAAEQELVDLKKLEHLSIQLDKYGRRIAECESEEKALREKLKDARLKAESKADGVKVLREAFLDCLLESKIPGFLPDDTVSIRSPHFLPEVSNTRDGVVQVTSFSNIGSGGKKTFFKCCFAVAVHLLAQKRAGILPTFLIIDSPMKNLSERENKDQFLGFHKMLYELTETDLAETQLIVIDSEMVAPPSGSTRSFINRHMTTDDTAAPPLITYYRGK